VVVWWWFESFGGLMRPSFKPITAIRKRQHATLCAGGSTGHDWCHSTFVGPDRKSASEGVHGAVGVDLLHQAEQSPYISTELSQPQGLGLSVDLRGGCWASIEIPDWWASHATFAATLYKSLAAPL